MARTARTYRKVEPDMWTSGDFRALSAPSPNAQTLWQYLLTGQRTIAIPGVVVARPAVMADDLRWPQRAFDRCLAEIVAAGMAEVDREVGLVVLTKALVSDGRPRDTAHPGSPNGVRAWAAALSKLPACRLRDVVAARLAQLMALIGGAFPSHFAEAIGESCTKTSPTHPASIDETITHSGIRDQGSGNSEISLPRAREADPAPAPPAAEPPAFAPLEPLVSLAIDQLNAARAALDPDAPAIAALGDAAGVQSLLDRLRPLQPADREPTLRRAIGVLVAWVRADGKPVGELRLGQLAGERSWGRWLAGSVKDVQRAAARAREGSRFDRDRGPAPPPAAPSVAETQRQLEEQRAAAARAAADRESVAADLARAKEALGVVGGLARKLGGQR